jgi:hypothetical protein
MRLLIAIPLIAVYILLNSRCTPRHHQESKHVQIQKEVEQLIKIKKETFNKK